MDEPGEPHEGEEESGQHLGQPAVFASIARSRMLKGIVIGVLALLAILELLMDWFL